jgi:GNAT superfamily N-acetyltransferase
MEVPVTPPADVQLREAELDQGHLRAVAALLSGRFPKASHLGAQFLAWQYLESPEGVTRCFEAVHRGVPVAHAAFSPLHARLDGESVTGRLVHNVATDARFEGRGIFSALLGAGIEAARAAGDRLVVSVPNDRSAGVFVERHGFAALGPLEVRIGVGPMPPPQSEQAPRFQREWSRQALAWRLRRPGARYSYRHSGDEILLETQTGFPGIRAELARVPATTLANGAPLRILRSPRGRPTGRLYIGLEPGRRWALRPYVSLPLSARPAPLHLVFRDLWTKAAPHRGDVRFRLLDFDAY